MLKELCTAVGVSGNEAAAVETARTYLSQYGDVKGNSMGSLLCRVGGEGEKLLLDAHIDEIGFVVTAVDDDGFLRVAKSGGVDLRLLLGNEVTVWGEQPLYGVFCCKPPHLIASRSDYEKAPELTELAVDIGLSAEKARELVHLGDAVSLHSDYKNLLNNKVSCKSLDDRAGMAAILYCLNLIKGRRLKYDLYVLFSVQEEVGTRGAGAGTFGVMPQKSIAVDVSFAMTPDSPRSKCGDLGKGPMVGVSPVLSRGISNDMQALAKKYEIPFQLEIMGGETGTNADAISLIGCGVESGLLSVPLKYMHTPVEEIDLDDVKNTGRLLAAYLSDGEGEI